MSYQVIARKWRPQTFEEVTGQETITQTLRNALEHDRLHHAYLFSGARGVGKTTTARLLAKALNCHKTDRPNLHPCSINDPDPCPSCLEISESRSMDVLEIDAASHTGIDSVRDTIIESININPARDRYKVFIIDEVHQLSKPAFNALLKTLEEPPPNVVFIMATTELHKVPDTILSRCQEFLFRTIPLQKIFDRLKLIAGAEKIDISDDALREIARSGEGSMRDAQSNFDQVISFSGEKISVDDVGKALGFASIQMLAGIVDAIAKKEPQAVLTIVDDLISRGQDLRSFCRDLLSVFRDLLVFKVSGGTESLVEMSVLTAEQMRGYAAEFSETDLLRFFNSLADTETRLKEATQTRYVVEIGLVKLIEMRRIPAVEKMLERLSALERSLGDGGPPAQKPSETPEESRSAAYLEKKTLAPEPSPVEIVAPPVEIVAPPVEEPDARLEEAAPVDPPSPRPAIDVSSFHVKLPAISSEELEHVDDSWLDSQYELRLTLTGDDLGHIANAEQVVRLLLSGIEETATADTETFVEAAMTASAPARAKVMIDPAVFHGGDEGAVPDVLPENPSDEELFAYAQNHPAVKRALRTFRGKLLAVRKIPVGP